MGNKLTFTQLAYRCLAVLSISLFFLAQVTAQCGVTIPDGEHCEDPAGDNCEFYICTAGACVPSGAFFPVGTKCGCFGDECYDDFCDAAGICQCQLFIAPSTKPCASDRNVCDGVDQCDGFNGRRCLGIVSHPEAACNDGVFCTVDCNPKDTCVVYPIHTRCDDNDTCTVDSCDLSGLGASCTNVCGSSPACQLVPPCLLPVELVNFTGRFSGNKVVLEWMTTLEKNNLGFDIQLSFDGQMFESLGFIPGAGTVDDAQFYDFEFDKRGKGIYIIRLKQIDIDGKHNFSHALYLNLQEAGSFHLSPVYPNPVADFANITFASPERGRAYLRLYDRSGRLLKTLFQDVTDEGRVYHIRFGVSSFKTGIYFYELSCGVKRKVKKLIII